MHCNLHYNVMEPKLVAICTCLTNQTSRRYHNHNLATRKCTLMSKIRHKGFGTFLHSKLLWRGGERCAGIDAHDSRNLVQ